jgi:hypothetical protein
MTDSLIICNRCTSNACYEYKIEEHTAWHCFGCGFTSNDTLNNKNPNVSESLSVFPELYKDLKYIDESGNYWIPSSINNPSVGIVFADGTSTGDWQWAAVVATPILDNEKHKFPEGQTHKMDMKTIKYFSEKDYMEALDYIGYFDKK